MSNEGWVKVHRKILDCRWIKSPKVLSVFIQCILRANFKDNEVENELIKRGEFMTSIESLSNFTALTSQEVRTALSKLKSTNEITIRATNKYTIISVCKYEIYQSSEFVNQQANQQADQQANNKQITNKQQTNNKQLTTTKNDNKENNDKNEENDKNKDSDLKVGAIEKRKLKYQSLLEHEYFRSDTFREKWDLFNEQKGKKATIISKIQGLEKLFKFSLEESIEALENSIVSNWAGLFPKNKPKRKLTMDEALEQAGREIAEEERQAELKRKELEAITASN